MLNGLLGAASGCLPHVQFIKDNTSCRTAGGRASPALGRLPTPHAPMLRAASLQIASSVVGVLQGWGPGPSFPHCWL